MTDWATPRPPFWERRGLWAALMLASLIPFLGLSIYPFNDLANHIGRHFVFLNIDRSPFLQRFYAVHWHLIGNLGVDVLVRLFGPLFGADLATRLVVAAIPPLTILGVYALARALCGRVPPAAVLGVPLAFNWQLITGFTNFCLAAALALNVLALWVRLRAWPFGWRLLLFAPLGFATWVAHTAGWGLLGLGVLAYEVARACRPRPTARRLLSAPLQTLPFALMLLFTILWRSGTSTGIGIGIQQPYLLSKAISVLSIFRERFVDWDVASAAIYAVLLAYFFVEGGRRLIPSAAAVAGATLVAFLLCPQELFKSGFADRRLLSYAVMLLPLAIGVAPAARADPRVGRRLAFGVGAALAFFTVRLAVTTLAWHAGARADERHLAILDRLPRHSRVFGLVVEPCEPRWTRVGRPDHIQQYALVRRESFVNGLFQVSGLNQVEVFAARDTGFDPNMLAVVHDRSCPVPYIRETLQSALAGFPRRLYDHVWLLSEEPLPSYDATGLELVAASGNDRLYRVAG